MPPEFTSAPQADHWSVLKAAAVRFEENWRRKTRPVIDEFLPTDEPPRFRVLVELVHIDLELRLKLGESARAETYLQQYPELASDRTIVLELIAAEYELRLRQESNLSVDEYLQRFPRYRSEILEKLARWTNDRQTVLLGSREPLVESPPRVAGYEMLGLLGRGGMGVVYKARQHSLDRLVAVKFLPGECARDPVWLARFRREARTASGLNHPHICTIYDTGESAGWPYLSMELVEGRTLETLIRDRKPVGELAQMVGQAARALAASHAAGVVHRDVKPANLMVRDDGIVKVLDFGLAHRVDSRKPHAREHDGHKTDPAARVGTLLYMSPEQARVEPLDSATDIFSLGLVLYELATGQHPFQAESDADVLHAIISRAPIQPSHLNPQIPRLLDDLILHMLTKSARLRPTAAEVDAALARLATLEPYSSREVSIEKERRPVVGRGPERAKLCSGFEDAVTGQGSVLCVTGEPGLGKTTLVERFLEELTATGRLLNLASGRCSERLAGVEAYLPFLDALDSLLQGDSSGSVATAMKLLAPTWYAHVTPLVASALPSEQMLAQAKETSQERRKRELGVFLQEISGRRPVVLFLDDIHWADPSSVDLLSYLGSKCANWRLLIIVAYRPSDLLRSKHPFGSVKLELQARGICREVTLPFLSQDEFESYLALAFVGHCFPEEFALALHARTEGNPLFMVDLLCYLRDQETIIPIKDGWALARAVPDLQRELPESVRGMIQRKLDQLEEADRQLLMAASVTGPEFDSAIVAELLNRDAAEVEERLNVLERVHFLVRLIREREFPDATFSMRYGFVHSLYQNALFAALQPTRRASWSGAAASALLTHYGDRSPSLAYELAMLFEAARDPGRATDHLVVAAEKATRIFAHSEAVTLARRGWALLQALPDTPERIRRELPLQIILGTQIQLARGYANPEVEQIYNRALELCELSRQWELHFRVLWWLWMFYEVSSHAEKSRQLAERLLKLGEEQNDAGRLIQGRQALAIVSLWGGDLLATREHVQQGIALYAPEQHAGHTHIYGQNPKVSCLAFGAVALWLLGYPDQAMQYSREAIGLGGMLAQPNTLALSLYFGAMLRQYLCEGQAVEACGEAVTAVAAEHGLSFWLAAGAVMRGWGLAQQQGTGAAGIAHLRKGLIDWAATGGGTYRTYHQGLLAEALGQHGQLEEAISVIDKSLSLVNSKGESFHGAELHRLKGEFLLGQDLDAWPKAEASFQRALEVSRRQQAKSLELRATMSLTRLYQKQGRVAEALPTLANCYGWFTEGFDTHDLKEARGMLEQLGGKDRLAT